MPEKSAGYYTQDALVCSRAFTNWSNSRIILHQAQKKADKLPLLDDCMTYRPRLTNVSSQPAGAAVNAFTRAPSKTPLTNGKKTTDRS